MTCEHCKTAIRSLLESSRASGTTPPASRAEQGLERFTDADLTNAPSGIRPCTPGSLAKLVAKNSWLPNQNNDQPKLSQKLDEHSYICIVELPRMSPWMSSTVISTVRWSVTTSALSPPVTYWSTSFSMWATLDSVNMLTVQRANQIV